MPLVGRCDQAGVAINLPQPVVAGGEGVPVLPAHSIEESVRRQVSDGTVWMYHAPTGRCMQVFVGHEGGATAGCFTPDGRWVVTTGMDGTCRVWAPKTGAGRHVFRLVAEGGGGSGAAPAAHCRMQVPQQRHFGHFREARVCSTKYS